MRNRRGNVRRVSGLPNRNEKLVGRDQIAENLRANSRAICRKLSGSGPARRFCSRFLASLIASSREASFCPPAKRLRSGGYPKGKEPGRLFLLTLFWRKKRVRRRAGTQPRDVKRLQGQHFIHQYSSKIRYPVSRRAATKPASRTNSINSSCDRRNEVPAAATTFSSSMVPPRSLAPKNSAVCAIAAP